MAKRIANWLSSSETMLAIVKGICVVLMFLATFYFSTGARLTDLERRATETEKYLERNNADHLRIEDKLSKVGEDTAYIRGKIERQP